MSKQTIEKKGLLETEVSIFRVSLVQKAIFAKHLSIMLKAGLPITEALNIAKDSASGKLKKRIKEISKSVKAGSSLSSSFARYPKTFSSLFVSATYAGETSGTLTESLQNIANQLEKEKILVAKIKGAMLYPIVVLTAAFLLGIILAFIVLPKITPLFEGLKMDLPATTRALIWFSHFIQDYGLYFLIGVISFIIFIIWVVRQNIVKPITHWVFLHMPILKNIASGSNLARFSRTLAMLLKSGVNIDEALEITKDMTTNYYYRKALKKISGNIRKGMRLSDSLGEFDFLFPPILVNMIRVGEESGNFEETLFYLADFYETEVDNATKSLSTAIEPILLIIIGAVVGFLALSIITPIYDVTGNVSR